MDDPRICQAVVRLPMASMTRPINVHLVVGMIGMTVLLASCGKHPAPEARQDSSSEVAPTPPPEMRGPPIGSSDSVINAIEPRLAPWVAMWRKAMPGFEVDSLYRVGTHPSLRGSMEPLAKMLPAPGDSSVE